MNNLNLETAINDAVNIIHQFGNELVAILSGDPSSIPCDQNIAGARAVGILNQQFDVAERLYRAFHEPRKETADALHKN